MFNFNKLYSMEELFNLKQNSDRNCVRIMEINHKELIRLNGKPSDKFKIVDFKSDLREITLDEEKHKFDEMDFQDGVIIVEMVYPNK